MADRGAFIYPDVKSYMSHVCLLWLVVCRSVQHNSTGSQNWDQAVKLRFWSTFQQAVVGLSPRVTVLAGQDAHRLFVRLPGLRADPEQLTVDLTLRHPRAVAVVNLQLEELAETQRKRRTSSSCLCWWFRREMRVVAFPALWVWCVHSLHIFMLHISTLWVLLLHKLHKRHICPKDSSSSNN